MSLLRWGRLVALCLLAAVPARAEPATASFASYLAELGLHREAVTELRRLQWLEQPEWLAPGLGYGYGVRLLSAGLTEEAAAVLAGAIETDPDRQRAERHQRWWAVALARTGDGARAVALLSRLESFASEPELRTEARSLRCLVHLSLAEAAMGTECARSLLGGTADADALDALATSSSSWALRYGIASALLPGLGQAWGGQWLDAGGALLVNGWLGYSAWSLVESGMGFDATMLALLVGSRYYIGNIQHGTAAGRAAAEERRRAGARTLADQVVRTLAPKP